MTTLTNFLEAKRSLDQQKIRACSEALLTDSNSSNGQSTTFDLKDFGRAMLDVLKKQQERIPQQPDPNAENRTESPKLDLSPEELKDETLLGHLRNRGKFKDTYTSTDARMNMSLDAVKKTLKAAKENAPVLHYDFDFVLELLADKTTECEELKEKLDQLSGEFILAAYRANQWQAMYEKSVEYLKTWHTELIKQTHLRSLGQSLRR